MSFEQLFFCELLKKVSFQIMLEKNYVLNVAKKQYTVGMKGERIQNQNL